MGENEQVIGGTDSQFTPIASQEDLDKIVLDRLHKERKKFADYEDLKTKAAKFDEIHPQFEDMNAKLADYESKIQTATQQLESYQKAEELSTLKAQVSKETGIPAAALRGQTLEELQQHAEVLKESFIPEPSPSLGRDGNQPGQGEMDVARQVARQVFGSKT